jgi:hypothetical protein
MNGSPSLIPSLPSLRSRAARRAAAGGAPDLRPKVVAEPSRRAVIPVFSLAALVLAGCAGSGDFGRPKASLWTDAVLPATGSLAAQTRGEPVSHYAYTDNENELRNRAWRFLMPAQERFWFEAVVVELVRTRILPVTMTPYDKTSYYRGVMHETFRSPASRYHRIADDASADAKLIGPFAVLAKRVIAADRVRLRSLAFVQDLAEDDAYQAAARVAENRCMIAWVRHETARRLESYRYALEHLLIEAPQNEAITAERVLRKLAAHMGILDELSVPPLADAACAGDAGPVDLIVRERPAVAPGGPIVAKG